MSTKKSGFSWDKAAKEFGGLGKIQDLKEYIVKKDEDYIKEIQETECGKKLNIQRNWGKHDFYQLPHPYFGNIATAKIIVLLTNPGDGPQEIGECADNFDRRLGFIKNANKTKIIDPNAGGYDWSMQVYKDAFWSNEVLEERIINENKDFDKLVSSCKDSEKFCKQLKDIFSLDEKTSKEIEKFIKQMEKNKTPYLLSNLYKTMKEKKKTTSLCNIFVRQLRICLINRYVASVEYYPYHSTSPENFSFRSPDGKKYCLPSTDWIIRHIEDRLNSGSAVPVFIAPRKNGRELWIDTDNEIIKKYQTIPVEGLKELGNKGKVLTAVKGSKKATMLKPENLLLYVNGEECERIQVDGNTTKSKEAEDVMTEVLDSIISELKS